MPPAAHRVFAGPLPMIANGGQRASQCQTKNTSTGIEPAQIVRGQGRLIITEDTTNDRLYLHCEECESGWLDPETVNDASKRFLTLTEEFDTVNPSLDRIQSFGWIKYALNSFYEGSE